MCAKRHTKETDKQTYAELDRYRQSFHIVSIRLFDGHQSDYLKNLIYKFSCMFSV